MLPTEQVRRPNVARPERGGAKGGLDSMNGGGRPNPSSAAQSVERAGANVRVRRTAAPVRPRAQERRRLRESECVRSGTQEPASGSGATLRHLVTLLEDQAVGVAFVSLGNGIDRARPGAKLQLCIVTALAECGVRRNRRTAKAGLARARVASAGGRTGILWTRTPSHRQLISQSKRWLRS